MQKIEIKRTQIEFDIYGQTVIATPLSVDELEEVYKRLEHIDAAEARSVWSELLCRHGFTKEILGGMELDHMLQVVDVMQGGLKKKSPTTS